MAPKRPEVSSRNKFGVSHHLLAAVWALISTPLRRLSFRAFSSFAPHTESLFGKSQREACVYSILASEHARENRPTPDPDGVDGALC